MKARIVGFVLLSLILGGLYVLTESESSPQPITVMPSSSDNDFKNLKIN